MTIRLAACLSGGLLLAIAVTPQPVSQTPRDRLERAYSVSNRGVAFLEQYDYAAAAGAFRDALRIDPNLAAAHLDLAIALLYAGDTASAQPEARAAAAALPAAPQPFYTVGLIARAENRNDDAEAAFRKVLTIDGSDAGSNVNLGQLLLQKSEYREAAAAFRAAVDAEPYNATAEYGLAMALTRAGDTAAGQQAMAKFQSLRDSPYAVTYTQTYLGQGRYGEAIASTGAEPGLVDRATPSVSFSEVPAAVPDDAANATGAILFDVNGAGDLDLLLLAKSGARLLHRSKGRYEPASAIPAPPAGAVETVAAAGDYDNDGRTDIFLTGPHSGRLLHQRVDGTFEDVTAAAGLSRDAGASAASWVDVDHDGDLDLVTANPVRLLRNNGNGTFTDITRQAGLTVAPGDAAAPAAVVPTDYDNRRDVDLLILSGGGAPHLFRNLRDGTFQDAAASAGLPQQADIISAAVADINKDGFVDFFFGRAGKPGLFALSDGRGRFTIQDAPPETTDAALAQFFDYDNDGLLDLLVAGRTAPRLLRNVGTGWIDETAHARLDRWPVATRGIALGDLDKDGDIDAVLAGASGVAIWRNDGGSRNHALAVALNARVSNRGALGSKVEIRAGSLRQMLETAAASPAVGPADLLFGLGSRPAADVVRVLWPSGILQSEIAPVSPIHIRELDRKPSSCPYLFTWNGSRFEFVTDFLGGGEMGDWEAPGRFDTPDPDEYVRVPDGFLRVKDGRYEIRVTNELEEAMFLDRVQLVAVDHPPAVEIYPNEGLKDPPRPPSRIYAVRNARVPERAVDDRGRDVRALIAARDRRWPEFGLTRFRGYAEPHMLTLDLGGDTDRAALLLTGWTAYAFSTDNVAAAQAGLTLQSPVLQVRDSSGAWQTIDRNVGFPVGRPQTIVVDMTRRWLGPSHEIRIVTNMPIYWDQILVASLDDRSPTVETRLDASRAVLAWRGFSAETTPDGREPFGADYAKVSTRSPWKYFPGAYTREGDVRALLGRSDDMFVIAKPGDEIALSFDASAAPPLRPGWVRTFLLYADGYSKEMNIASATPDSLGPLPFHAMSKYPYAPSEQYPDDAAHREYVATYNTRFVPRVVPSIDAAALAHQPPNSRKR